MPYELSSLDTFIEAHIKTIEYLVNDVFNRSNRDDIRQDLLLFMCKLYDSLIKRKLLPKNINNYVFISLKNKRNKLLQKSIYKNSIIIESNTLDRISFINETLEEETHEEVENTIKSIISTFLSPEDQRVIYSYFYENKTMTEIGKSLGITQQGVSKKMKLLIEKIRYYYENG